MVGRSFLREGEKAQSGPWWKAVTALAAISVGYVVGGVSMEFMDKAERITGPRVFPSTPQ